MKKVGRPKKEYEFGALSWAVDEQGKISTFDLLVGTQRFQGLGKTQLRNYLMLTSKEHTTARVITYGLKQLQWLLSDDSYCFKFNKAQNRLSIKGVANDSVIYLSDLKAYTGTRIPNNATVEYILKEIKYHRTEDLSQMGDSVAQAARNRYKRILTGKKDARQFQRDIRSWKLQADELVFLWHFQHGGLCWANPNELLKLFTNAYHIDFTSQYPFLLATQTFPVSSGRKVYLSTEDNLNRLMKRNKAVIFKAIFKGIRATTNICWLRAEKALNDFKDSNSNLVYAEECSCYLSSETWKRLKRSYTWDDVILCYGWVYELGRMNKGFIQLLLEDYIFKTQLKGIPGREAEYQERKVGLNNQAGALQMCPIPDIPKPERKKCFNRLEEIQAKLNTGYNKPQFMEKSGEGGRYWHYPQGLWLTELGKCWLLDILLDNEDQALYCDTDGAVFKNKIDIEKYNTQISKANLAAQWDLKLDKKLFNPMSSDKVWHPLGRLEEETYEKFKMVGQKRYMWQCPGKEVELCHSGVFIPESLQCLLEAPDPFEAYNGDFSMVRAPIIDYLTDEKGERYIQTREIEANELLPFFALLATAS